MPSYTRGVLRDQVTFVKIASNANVFYGFNTKNFGALPDLSGTQLLSDLGHIDAIPTGGLIIIRASSPKPPRVRRTLVANPTATQQGSVSTFCAIDKLNDALNAGWQLAKRGNSVSIANNARTVGAVAELSNGLLVVTPMNKADFDNYGTELGLQGPAQITSAERERLVFGASRPKAGQAVKDLGANGTVTKPFSTSANIENAGWTVLQTELL